MNPLPAWIGVAPAAEPCPISGVRTREPFVERTLLGVAALVADEADAAREAALPGLLQPIDARAKIVAAGLVLVAIGSTRSLAALGAAGVFAVALAAASRLDVASFLRRAWLVAPLFGAIVGLPAIFAIATPGPEILGHGAFAVTRPGLAALAALVLRVGASVSVALLLSRTSGAPALLAGLRGLGVPRALALAAGMTWRYLFVLAREVEEMHLGLLSRRLRPLRAGAGRAFVASRVAVLLARSRRTAEDVHLAMVSRGFRGEWRPLAPTRLRARDAIAVIVAALIATAIAFGGGA